MTSIKTKIKKNPSKRSAIVADAWVGVGKKPKFKAGDYDIEITDIRKVEVKGQIGVEIFARAWDKNGQIGFGKDGTVDIERFRFFGGLPFEVPDGTKTLKTRELPDGETEEYEYDNHKEDVEQTIMGAVIDAIRVKKEKSDDSKIIVGKVGRTTSTFYSDTGNPGTDTVDVRLMRSTGGSNWSDIRDGIGTNVYNDNDLCIAIQTITTSNEYYYLIRSGGNFDISAIGSDEVSSASVSVTGTSNPETFSGTPPAIGLTTWTPATENTGVTGDYSNFGSARISSDISAASWDNGTADGNVFSLNSTGITAIETALSGSDMFGVGFMFDWDIDDSPTWESNKYSQFNFHASDYGSNKPKLTVEHEATVTDTGFFNIL